MERLLNDAEEMAGIGSFEVDLRTHELTWSDSLYRLYGYRPGEVEMTLERMLAHTHPDEQHDFRVRTTRMFESPYPVRREYRIQLDDGSVRHLIAKSEVEREDDEPIRLFGVVQDVTDLRREQQRLARMQRILETAERLLGVGSYELDLRTAELIWSDELYRLNGFEPEAVEPSLELAIERMHPDDRETIRSRTAEMFKAPRPMTAEYRIQLDDRTLRYVVAEGVIERDDTGEPARLFGTVRDVTEQRLTERELQAHYALTQALSEWHSFEQGVVDLLRQLGTTMDWDAASIWVRADRGDTLVCRAFWASPSAELAEFEHALRGSEAPPGVSTVRRVWDLMEPIGIVESGTDPSAADRTEALPAGLRSVLLFPAVHDGETLAVLAFYGREPRRLTARLIRTLSALGHDLGRFLAQRRAEIGLRPLSARELEVLQLAARGLSGPMIAERLVIGSATVKTHFEHIYEKLGVTDRTAAVAEAMRQGLIS
jgi:PAS domain S-box-containing protein